MPSGIVRQAHTLVQDAEDADRAVLHAVDDHMPADRIDAVRAGQVGVCMADGQIASKGFERRSKLVAIDRDLLLAPALACVEQDVFDILFRLG